MGKPDHITDSGGTYVQVEEATVKLDMEQRTGSNLRKEYVKIEKGVCQRSMSKKWEYQTTLLASKETCIQVKKQQLELDIEQQTVSKLGKEYVKAVYFVTLLI